LNWTEGRLKAFITSVLRAGFRKYPAKYETLNEAKKGRKINPASGRMAEHYTCNDCKGDFPAKDVHIDHIFPVVSPEDGFTDWDSFIRNLFCGKENLQVLCKSCHLDGKTKEENKIRKLSQSIRKRYPQEEGSYRNMLSRCYNKNATGYEYYGGRGIGVCDMWREDFFSFYKDMGPRPENTTLDRVDVHGDYTKENCRWATSIEQGRNTTANNFVEYEEEIRCLEDWGEVLGIKPNTILTRLRRGWPVSEALGKTKREKPFYNGRLSQEDIEELITAIDTGTTQTAYGKKIGMDSSQVSRIYNRFKLTAKERGERKK